MKKLYTTCIAFAISACLYAQAPQKMSYQSVIRNANGTLVASQNVGIRISILDGANAAVYVETHSATTNANGLATFAIGGGTPVTGTFAAIDWSTGTYSVKTETDPTGGTNYTILGTSQLLSVPYALYAGGSTSALSGTTNNVVKFTSPNTGGNSQITDNGTTVAINIPTPNTDVRLHVGATAGINTIKSTMVASPPTSISTAASIYGESTIGIGVIGSSVSQSGVYGISASTFGGTVGVNTGSGYGIWGISTGTGAAAMFDGGTNGKGVVVSSGASGFGTTNPTSRLTVIQPSTPVAAIDTFPAIFASSFTPQACSKGAVYGMYNTSNYGTGIQGIGYQGVDNTIANVAFATGNQDLGVYGSGNTAGVEGTSIGGTGVMGYNKSNSFAATTGKGNIYGVYGHATTVGSANIPATRYGVYGFATGATTNHAGFFSGNVLITGSIAKASGTFKIDHPTDPENKYLYHSFVESPDMMNIYNGNITTDANGFATVALPSYFDALNKDFRYQLTSIGTFAQAIISQEINGNASFVIQTSQPNVKVSWQVTGVRKDKYAEENRVVAEVEKEPEFKGYYLHAKAWGQPESKSIDLLTRPKDPSTMERERNPSVPEVSSTSANSSNMVGGAEVTTKKDK